MFEFIRGTLIKSLPGITILETGGIAYRIFSSSEVYKKFSGPGERATLYTSLIIRENAHSLYGFVSQSERDLFELLIQLSGIGPKIALCMIDHLGISGMQEAVYREDHQPICKVPGIGKKTAARLLLELKDKLPSVGLPDPQKGPHIPLSKTICPQEEMFQDALNALIHLGYKQKDAQQALEKTLLEKKDEKVDLSTLITSSLRNF